MTQPEVAEHFRRIEGMPERPREDPAATVDALEREVERERGPLPIDAEAAPGPVEGVAEDADLPDPVEESPAAGRGVEPPD
jgi:hypothetical protein